MKYFISLYKTIGYLILLLYASNVYAEYYLECNGAPNIIYIESSSRHPCRHRHAHPRHHARPHRHHWQCDRLEQNCNCDQDLATGDDNACLHPDMQIN